MAKLIKIKDNKGGGAITVSQDAWNNVYSKHGYSLVPSPINPPQPVPTTIAPVDSLNNNINKNLTNVDSVVQKEVSLGEAPLGLQPGQKIPNTETLKKLQQQGAISGEQDLARIGSDIYWRSLGMEEKKMKERASAPVSSDDWKAFHEEVYGAKQDDIPSNLRSEEVGSGEVPVVEPEGPNMEAYVAGLETTIEGFQSLLEEVLKPSRYEQKVDERMERVDTLTQNLYQRPDDFEAELEKYGFKGNIKDLQDINVQMASQKAEYDRLQEAVANQPVHSRIIGGTQDKLRRQAAIELGALASMSQALQGNAEMALDIAGKTVEMKYMPIEMDIANQQWQLEQIYGQMEREEQRRIDALNFTLEERRRLIEEEKEKEVNIASIMSTVAQTGADTATLKRIMNADNYVDAVFYAAPFLNISTQDPVPSKIGVDSQGNDLFWDGVTQTVRTADQLSTANLGPQVGEIKGLPSYDTRAANPGVNRSDRNNNPGNIKVSNYTKTFNGVVGVESAPALDGGNFLIFENPEAGIDAIGRLLIEGSSYKNKTAEQAIKTYNGGGSYGATDVGLNPGQDFQSQIQDPTVRKRVANQIARLEGFSGTSIPMLQHSPSSPGAMAWADLVEKGGVSLTDIPSSERSEVAEILSAKGIDLKETFLEDRKVIASLDNVVRAANTVTRDSTTALEMIDKSLLFKGDGVLSAGARVASSKVPGTTSYEIERLIESVKSNVGIDTLLNIKREGSGLGQVPQAQLITLQSVLGLLDIGRKPDLLKRDLEHVKDLYENIMKNAKEDLERMGVGYDERVNLQETEISDLNFKF